MGRRALLLVAAVLLAAIGTGVLFLYVTQFTGARNDGERVAVLVPAQTIVEGQTITDQLGFTTVSVSAADAEANGYVRSITQIRNKVAGVRLVKGLPMVAAQFGSPVTGLPRLGTGDDLMALSLDVDEAAQVGGFLYPNARISVWVLDADTKRSPHQVKLVVPEVTVATVGSTDTIRRGTTPTRSTARANSTIVTLNVTQAQAAQILWAKNEGELYFTLLGSAAKATPEVWNTEPPVGP